MPVSTFVVVLVNEMQETANQAIEAVITNHSITDQAHFIYSPFTTHPAGATFYAGHKK